MARINTQQPAVAKPVRVRMNSLSEDSWVELVSADDYSVPDPQRLWPDRDPLDADRRIQPGEFVFETPLFVYNDDPNDIHTFRARVLQEDGEAVEIVKVDIAPGETWTFPLAGTRLMKVDPSSVVGDIFQVRGDGSSSFQIMGSGTKGSAEQDQV